ncbi:hypothetical protein ACFYYL_40290 [Actinomadura geliboluensis]|uniref:hypothetical protein n=1 Tax=Actinomadura geliboluensis TaxID=882440 RepID=UPI00367A5A33
MTTVLRALGILAAAMILAAGCHDGVPREKSPPPDALPVEDGAPYLCDLVPEPAFRRSTGVTAPLKSDWSKRQAGGGLCLASLQGGHAPLGIEWSTSDGEYILRTQRENWAEESSHQLPVELGRGLAGYRPSGGLTGLPNYVMALFRCGNKKPWISINFVSVVRGRDAVQDMFDFMRIAEKRFGDLHKCTPRAS